MLVSFSSRPCSWVQGLELIKSQTIEDGAKATQALVCESACRGPLLNLGKRDGAAEMTKHGRWPPYLRTTMKLLRIMTRRATKITYSKGVSRSFLSIFLTSSTSILEASLLAHS